MRTNDKELLDLTAKFFLSEDEVRAAINDIRRGDDLICRHDQVEVDPGVLVRTEGRVRRELARTERKRVGYSWPLRAAAIAAALIIALGLTAYWLQPPAFISPRNIGPGVVLLAEFDATDYLSVALVQEDVIDQEVDDMLIMEVLDHWSAVNWEVDDVLGPGSDGQGDLINVSRGDWIGHLVC